MSSRTIRVTEKGKLKVKPDMTRISIELTGLNKEYSETVKASSEDTKALKSLLKKENFEPEDIRTLVFNVDIEKESYKDENDEWKTRFLGYRYKHTLKIEFPNDKKKLGDIFNLLTDCSLLPDFRLSFFLKDSEKSKSPFISFKNPSTERKSVVFPIPLGPSIHTISPCFICRDTFSSTGTFP